MAHVNKELVKKHWDTVVARSSAKMPIISSLEAADFTQQDMKRFGFHVDVAEADKQQHAQP